MKALVLFSLFLVTVQPLEAQAGTSGVIAPTCGKELMTHYRTKGIAFTARHDYLDAYYAFASSIQAGKTCPYLNPIWVYYSLMFEATAQLGLHHLDAASEMVGAAREYRTSIVLSQLSASDRKAVYANDDNLTTIESGISQIRASMAAAVRQYHAPPYVPSYHSSEEPTCDDESIDEVREDGKVVQMLSGAIYLVDDVDESTSSIWLTTDDVKACSSDGIHFKLIDGSDDVSARRLRT